MNLTALTILTSWFEKWHCRLRKWDRRRNSTTIACESPYRGSPASNSTQHFPSPAIYRLESRRRSGETTAWPDRRSDGASPSWKFELRRVRTSTRRRITAERRFWNTFLGEKLSRKWRKERESEIHLMFEETPAILIPISFVTPRIFIQYLLVPSRLIMFVFLNMFGI